MVSLFDGPVVAIGNNFEQFAERFNFIEQVPNEAIIDEMILSNNEAQQLTFTAQYVLNIKLLEDYESENLLIGKKDQAEFPLFIRQETDYYFASTVLKPPFSIPFAELLHDVFKEEHKATYTGYIRLEDIHPLVNPDYLMEIAKVLQEKDIPYMMAVIPVYTNPETKKTISFF